MDILMKIQQHQTFYHIKKTLHLAKTFALVVKMKKENAELDIILILRNKRMQNILLFNAQVSMEEQSNLVSCQ